MKGVEITNATMMNPNQQIEFVLRWDPYAINIDRNYYNCGGFGYITRNCRNWRFIEQGRRMAYKKNQSNLNRDKNLIVFN